MFANMRANCPKAAADDCRALAFDARGIGRPERSEDMDGLAEGETILSEAYTGTWESGIQSILPSQASHTRRQGRGLSVHSGRKVAGEVMAAGAEADRTDVTGSCRGTPSCRLRV